MSTDKLKVAGVKTEADFAKLPVGQQLRAKQIAQKLNAQDAAVQKQKQQGARGTGTPPEGNPLVLTPPPKNTPPSSQTPASVQTSDLGSESPTATASGFLQKVASIPKATPVTPNTVQKVTSESIAPSSDPNGVLRLAASMKKPTPSDPSASGATPSPSAAPITATKTPTPTVAVDEFLVLRKTPGYAYAPGTDPARMANPILSQTPIIDAGLKDAKNAQVHKYQDVKTGFSLLGGNQKYVYKSYSENSRNRGVFVDYPGASRRYDSTPQRNNTMARLAIPIVGSVEDFIAGAKLVGDAAKLAETLVIQGNTGLGYIDFLLQSVNEGFAEKVQISETVGDNYAAFFFGMAPPTFQFSGQLLNTFQDEWRTSMHILYQNLLRGSRLARTNSLVSIYYDRIIANGYILSHNQNFTAEMQMASAFNFTMLVKSISFFRLPETVPTGDTKIAGNIKFNTIAGIERGAVKKTTRTVGETVYAEGIPALREAATQTGNLTPLEAQFQLQLSRGDQRVIGPDGKELTPLQIATLRKELYSSIKPKAAAS